MSRTSGPQPPLTQGYANYVLGVLFVVYVFNFIDRQVLAILLDDIKQEIGVSDTYMGFLTGFAFVFFYTFAGIPIARLADRTSRRTIIAIGLATWSGMTAATGLVRNFTELALTRVGVGVGEAAGSPPAHSLISDYFPPERRATALSIYATGVYVGVMIAFVGGGWISEHFGWRSVYLTIGLAGIPLALLVRFTVRELPRGFSDPKSTRAAAGGSERERRAAAEVSVMEAFRYLLGCRSFLWITAAAAVQSLSGYGVLAWGPTFLGRVHEMPRVDIGVWLGVIIGVFGTAGAYLGGRLTDRCIPRDIRWSMRLPAIESIVAVPFVLGFLFVDDPWVALALFAPFYLLGAMYVGPMLSMTQSLVPPEMRAMTSAILLFVLNMVGLGLGPFAVGYLNDALAARYGAEAVRYSLTVVAMIGGTSGLLFFVSSRFLADDLQTLQRRQAAA